MAVGKPLHLRLFLEGIEVPVVAAQVSINVNAPATASIQIVPLDEGMDLRPRTMVHLFFLDQFQVIPSRDPSVDDKKNPDFLKNYRLLYSGEVVGFAFAKSPNQRSLVIQCLDFSSYWDAAQATAIEYGPFGNLFTNTGSLYASNTGIFDDIANQQAQKLVDWINKKPVTPGLTNVSGLAGGIIHMMEAMGGVPNHFRGVNDFFSIAELRCRLLAQITAEENDNTAYNLLSAKVFDEWLRNGLQQAGQQVSFRDMMKLLFNYIYYEAVPNPCAKFEPATTNISKGKKKILVNVSSNPSVLKVEKDLSQVLARLDDSTTVTLFTGVGLGPDNTAQHQILALVAAIIPTIKKSITSLTAVNKGHPADPITNSLNYLNRALTTGQSITSGSTAVSALSGNSFTFAGLLHLALSALTDATDDDSTVQVASTSKDLGSTARLHTQIIRPDCWFAAPPRCNVLFPELYTQISYDRTYIQEVTRMLVLVYASIIGPDSLLADRVLAPNIGSSTNPLIGHVGEGSYRILMDHELHTGIVARTEWLSNVASGAGTTTNDEKKKMRGYRLNWASRIALFHFFKYRFGPRQANVSGRFNPYMVCGFPALIIDRPFIIPKKSHGQNATSSDTLSFVQDYADLNGAPQQLVGMVAAVQHGVDQSGGTTSTAMHHVRRHSGVDDDFLDLFLKNTVSLKKSIQVPMNLSVIRDLQTREGKQLLKLLVDVTPQGKATAKGKYGVTGFKKVSYQQDTQQVQTTLDDLNTRTLGAQGLEAKPVTLTKSVSIRSETTRADTTPDFVTPGRIPGVTDGAQVFIPMPPGKLTANGKGVFGTIVGIEVVDPSTEDTDSGRAYRSVILHEVVDISLQTRTPIEEILRPGWFSAQYSNEKIGPNIYQPFFGCDSILDEFQVSAATSTAFVQSSTPNPVISPDISPQDLQQRFLQEAENTTLISIEKATNTIAYLYGVVRAQGLDVDKFISSYQQRPIATITDMLGSPDLQIDFDSSGAAQKVTGTVGFHTMAVFPDAVNRGNLTGLLQDPNKPLTRVSKEGKAEPLPPKYDVRKEKRDRVLKYLQALGKGPGFQG